MMSSRPWRCADGLASGSCTHSCGIVRDLDQPAHPYTRALLAYSPTVEHRANPLPTVAGSSPDPLETIAGCRFHPRCPRRLDQCSVNEPELVGNGHRVASWNPFKST